MADFTIFPSRPSIIERLARLFAPRGTQPDRSGGQAYVDALAMAEKQLKDETFYVAGSTKAANLLGTKSRALNNLDL